jgi:hypothetical protein
MMLVPTGRLFEYTRRPIFVSASVDSQNTCPSSAEHPSPNRKCERPRLVSSWRYHLGSLWISHVYGADRRSGTPASEDRGLSEQLKRWYPARSQTGGIHRSYKTSSQERVTIMGGQTEFTIASTLATLVRTVSSLTHSRWPSRLRWTKCLKIWKIRELSRSRRVLRRLPSCSSTVMGTFVSVWTTRSFMMSPRIASHQRDRLCLGQARRSLLVLDPWPEEWPLTRCLVSLWRRLRAGDILDLSQQYLPKVRATLGFGEETGKTLGNRTMQR